MMFLIKSETMKKQYEKLFKQCKMYLPNFEKVGKSLAVLNFYFTISFSNFSLVMSYFLKSPSFKAFLVLISIKDSSLVAGS